MAELIIYEATDGHIIIITPPPGVSGSSIVANVVPVDTDYKIILASNLPAVPYKLYDARFYDDTNEFGIRIDLPTARTIQVNRWRVARASLFPALDIAFMRALEINDTSSIITQKQTLRNVTSTDLSGCSTLTAIGETWPACLGSNPYTA